MIRMRSSAGLVVFVISVALAYGIVSMASPQDQTSTSASRESYSVYLCPVHRDQQSTGPGRCPVCDRELGLRVLVPSYSCPMHAQIDEPQEGRCPICNMKLVPTTRELQWYCPGRPDLVSSRAGGRCPDGSPMSMRSVPMAHGDHNPKHGGILFMAPNGYHHLEGTLAGDGTFRLYLYDDFTRPIDASAFTGTVQNVALEPCENGGCLLAKLAAGKPASEATELEVELRFPGDDQDTRFDFVFAPGSKATPTAASQGSAPPVALPEFRIPETPDAIYSEILRRNDRLQELIAKGKWPDLYIPALEAKDLVLALAKAEGDRVALPAKTLVRAAWLLDTYGDLGNRLQVESAYRLFDEGIRQLETAHERR